LLTQSKIKVCKTVGKRQPEKLDLIYLFLVAHATLIQQQKGLS